MGSRSPRSANESISFAKFSRRCVFGARSQTKLIACHIECKLQFGEVFVIEDFSVHTAPVMWGRYCSGLGLKPSAPPPRRPDGQPFAVREELGHLTRWSNQVTRWSSRWPTNNIKIFIYFNFFGLQMARWPNFFLSASV